MVIEKILPNAIVRVHFPELSESENKRRLKQIEKATINILTKETERK